MDDVQWHLAKLCGTTFEAKRSIGLNACVNGLLGLRVMVDFTFSAAQLISVVIERWFEGALPPNLISDIEKAISTRSADAGALLHRITDLFLLNVGYYSAAQLHLYDDVLSELITKVEVAARAKLAQRLAPVDRAPLNTIRSLALDRAIEVAESILSQSNALDDDTLSHCIEINGQEHLLAIATRKKVSESVSDKLIAKGNGKVLGTLASNPGATISDPGFGMLVQKSIDDDWLSECIAGREDIPEHHLRELLSKASEIVRQKLTSANPELSEIIQEILPRHLPSIAHKAPSRSYDFRAAEGIVKSRELTEAVVNEFTKEKKLAELIVSIAQLSGLSVDEIEKLFMETWTSPVAIILKAIGFHLSTVEAIYRSRLSNGEVARSDLINTKAEFIALRRATAERILRFFCARRAAKISNLSIS
jgi:hypothetical protein